MNPKALVEAVSKCQRPAEALRFVGAELPPPTKKPELPPMALTPIYEIEKAIDVSRFTFLRMLWLLELIRAHSGLDRFRAGIESV
jgi:hypothetical protein